MALRHAAYLIQGVHPDTCAVDLDLVRVHCCVGDQNLGILDALGLHIAHTLNGLQ